MSRSTIACVLGVLGAPSVLMAQACAPHWLPGHGFPGVESVVAEVKEWDPDGPGPQTPLQVVGGTFRVAGHIQANKIAAWDGVTWQALGTGLGSGAGGVSADRVAALEVYQGELIAGGWFYSAPGVPNHIARWDGVSWQPLGSGTGEGVSDLLVHDGDLIVGGTFTAAGGGPGNAIARWDGTAWHPLGSGMSGPPSSEDDVYALGAYDGDLIAAGSFDIAGGIPCNAIARWDGASWYPIGGGITTPQYGHVLALEEYDGELIAGGRFTSAGGTPANSIARWDGVTWQPLGSGVEYFEVFALCVYNGELIAGGSFTLAGGLPVNRIARWNGESWQTLGPGAGGGVLGYRVYALSASDDDLFVGGDFAGAADEWASYIARWDGAAWHSLGDATGMTLYIRALKGYEGDLIGAGEFFTTPGSSLAEIARWDGGSWEPIASLQPAPGYSYGTVYAFEPFQGDLIAGGGFSAAGGQPANNIAAWNGTSWAPFGNGTNGRVSALTVHDEQLIAGGYFSAAGVQQAWGIAAWDGAAWSPLGAGLRFRGPRTR